MKVAGRRVAVLGGDRRLTEAARELAAAGAWVRATHLVGEVAAAGLTRCSGAEEACVGAEIAVLPVQPVDDTCRVYTESPWPPLYIRPRTLEGMAPHAMLFVGAAGPVLLQQAAENNINVIEYRDRDDFAILNSVPTAEGAIGIALGASPLCLFDSHALVLGYGRTGTTLARLLYSFGAHVAVAVRSQTDEARVYAAGLEPVPFAEVAHAVAKADFIFNTVPALVMTRDLLALARRHVTIVDLASAPGGTDFAAAEEIGLTAVLAPALPGKVAPVTAGRLLADFVARCYVASGRAARSGVAVGPTPPKGGW